MPRQTILTVIVWICLTCAGATQTLTFPPLTGRVVDEAGLLNPADRASLTESLAALETKTTDQFVVVTLKSLQGTSIEDYGYQLGRQWKIGQKDKDSGVLLIVAPNERLVRIEVGYGLEGVLTDAMTKTIIETTILPAFKTGDFAGGIKRGAEAVVTLLTNDTDAPKSAPAPRDDPADWPAIVVCVFGVGLLIYCAVTGGVLCQLLMQILYLVLAFSGGRGSSRGGSSFSGGGGSFGGGGSSGRW